LIVASSAASVFASFETVNTPSCYEFDVSWLNGTVEDFIFPIYDASQCQTLCKNSMNCSSWTWNTEKNHEIKDACILYSSTGEKAYFPETVSGPRSCVCSENVACSATEDNLIRFEENVNIEETCQELCHNSNGCQFYTWYDTNESLAHICFLLTDCKDRFEGCSGCHSGPPSCETVPDDELAIVVTGGLQTANYSAEALYSNGTRLCRIPDIPREVNFHTMSGSLVCGGEHNYELYCINFENGTWKTMPFMLQEERVDHVSWRRADGKTRLLGGLYSPFTSELVSDSGSVSGFPMKYSTMNACSIELEDRVIVTGGYYTRNTVSIYYDDGWHQDLADLNTGRYWHSCSHYISGNELKYTVAGGSDGPLISSTEIYSPTQLKWNYGVQLPSDRELTRGISVNNNVFLLGGKGNGIISDVLKLDQENGEWMKVGEMSMPRKSHAVSVMPLKDILPFCVPEQ